LEPQCYGPSCLKRSQEGAQAQEENSRGGRDNTAHCCSVGDNRQLHISLAYLLPRVAARLALDHAAVINPNTETPFSDVEDVVHRLLPYHVFLHPKEDIDRKGKGKEKASDVETEIEGWFFSLLQVSRTE
jgi:hypothetical protein